VKEPNLKAGPTHRSEYANWFRVAGPTKDRMIHLTFTREDLVNVQEKDDIEFEGDPAHKVVSNSLAAEPSREAVVTMILPVSILRELGSFLHQVSDALDKAMKEHPALNARSNAEE